VVDPNIKDKISHLESLAERPGTLAEGEVAKNAAIRLSLKYGIKCKFVPQTPPRPPKVVPQPKTVQEVHDALFYRWIAALRSCGWDINESVLSKIGPQLRFRKPGFQSEIRITQRKNSDGKDFEAEHIMSPDPDADGKDWSYTSFMCTTLEGLSCHIGYTKNMDTEPPPKWDKSGRS
jgi:hypothetical protein